MDRNMLMQKLMELDFLAVDMGLFLNTHPDSSEAIAAYNEVIEAADKVRLQYEENFGPLCSFRSYAADPEHWLWERNPWPWQKDANTTMGGKECR